MLQCILQQQWIIFEHLWCVIMQIFICSSATWPEETSSLTDAALPEGPGGPGGPGGPAMVKAAVKKMSTSFIPSHYNWVSDLIRYKNGI